MFEVRVRAGLRLVEETLWFCEATKFERRHRFGHLVPSSQSKDTLGEPGENPTCRSRPFLTSSERLNRSFRKRIRTCAWQLLVYTLPRGNGISRVLLTHSRGFASSDRKHLRLAACLCAEFWMESVICRSTDAPQSFFFRAVIIIQMG